MEKFITKYNLLISYLSFTLGFYNLQLSKLDGVMLKFLLLIGVFLGIYIIFKYNDNTKNMILLFFSIIFSLLIFKGDTRITTVILTGYIFKDENIYDYFLPMFLISFVTLLINIFIGYGHMNGCGMHIGTCIFLYLCYKQNKVTTCDLFTLFFLIIIGFIYTNSAQFLVCTIFVVFFIFLLKSNKVSKFILKLLNMPIISFTIPFLAFLNYYLPVSINQKKFAYIGTFFSNQINEAFLNSIYTLDRFMSYRLSLSEASLRMFGFKWIGNTLDSSVTTNIDGYFNLDSGYLQILQTKGIIFLIIFLVVMVLILRYFIKRKEYILVIITIALALWAINEDITLTIRTNFVIIFWFIAIKDFVESYVIQKLKKGKDEKK